MISTIIRAASVFTAIDAHNITIGINNFILQFKKKIRYLVSKKINIK